MQHALAVRAAISNSVQLPGQHAQPRMLWICCPAMFKTHSQGELWLWGVPCIMQPTGLAQQSTSCFPLCDIPSL